MSWQLHFTLPWKALDRAAIRAAAEHVLGCGIGLTRYKIEDRDPNLVWVLFYFPAKVERRWEPSNARDFPLYNIVDDDESFVHFTFRHVPPDNGYDLPEEVYFEFYSGISGNRLFSGVGVEVATHLGEHFGVKCRPD